MEDNNRIKVCHFTSVHAWDDIRIFKKMCTSLAKLDYEVILIAPNAEEGTHNGVHVKSVEVKAGSRLSRIFKTSKLVYQKALNEDADLYHFHDPELLRYGKKLAKKGKSVIYDSHEDVPEDILDKTWIGSRFIRSVVSKLYNRYEKKTVKKLSGVISVTDPITKKFNHKNAVSIHNYPLVSKFQNLVRSNKSDKLRLIYSGGLTRIRGIQEMVDAMGMIKSDAQLIIAGRWESDAYLEECKASSGWSKVDYKGFIDLDENYQLMGQCDVGLVNFMPVGNHLNSLPNKAFEYFAAGLVVQMSNLEFWLNEFGDYAKYHEPKSAEDIAAKIDYLADNKANLADWGEKAKNFILSNRSWESQANLLSDFYIKIINK